MKVFILTLGCKVNQAESASLERRVRAEGRELALTAEDADEIIVNTCAVTAEAARKSRQALRRVSAFGKKVYAAGCYAKTDREVVTKLGAEIIDISDGIGAKPAKRTRALLKVQDGCENRCSYCVIPYARGASRSLPLAECAAAIRDFAAQGVKETIITGVEISSWGRDLPGSPTLSDLAVGLSAAEPDMRLALGSLEPRVVTESFCKAIAGIVTSKFHLSLQSGCDSVLRRMNRLYDTAHFRASVWLLRQYFPDSFISADVIVGFPGESEQEFEQTREFIQTLKLNKLHVFPYSPRPETPAAKMTEQLEKAVKTRRAEVLRSLVT
jgi:threonylcarbamoyladenosine tRNA methylthiotransferase MtaB